MRWFPLPAIATVLLCACGSNENSIANLQVERPLVVKLHTVRSTSAEYRHRFPAKISAVKTVDIAFEVSGRLTHVDLVEGRKVKQGHPLAAIDSTPFERRVQESRARMVQTKSMTQRLTTLMKQKMASQQEYDQVRTEAEIAELELSSSIQKLSYTALAAPFDALVSERLVENDSYVRAGDVIARLQDVSRVYFTIDVAERFLTTNLSKKLHKVLANYGGEQFPLSYVEHSTQPDPITQTYKVVFAMEPIPGRQFTPGSSAFVTVFIRNQQSQGIGVIAPLSALDGGKDQGFTIWRLQSETGTVEQVPVQVGKVESEFVTVTAGLEEGDRVVAAGVSKLFEGRTVKEYLLEH